MLKIFHTADVHLGAKLNKLGFKREEQRVQIQKTFEKIVDLAIDSKVNAFLIAGDLFDNNNPEEYLINFLKVNLERLNDRHIYTFISAGTHDYLHDGSIYHKLSDLPYIKIFNEPNISSYTIEDLSLIVFCNTLISNKTSFGPLSNIKRNDKYKYNIAMAHGSIQIPGKSSVNDAPITIQEIDNSDMDYIALGHWHNNQKINSKVETWYSGAPEMVNLDQDKSGNILQVIIDDDNKVSVTSIPVGARKFDSLKINISSFRNVEDLILKISEGSDRNLVREIIIEGTVDESFGQFDLNEIKRRVEDKFFFLIIKNVSNVVPKLIVEEDFSDDLLKSKFVEILRKSNSDEKTIEDALQLGIILLDGKSQVY